MQQQARCSSKRGAAASAALHLLLRSSKYGHIALGATLTLHTVASEMFGKPLLNNVLRFDHAQLQK